MSGFPEPAWFEAVRAELNEMLPATDGRDARVQFEGRDGDARVRWVQEFSDGMLSRFELGQLDGPDVMVSWRLADALPIMRGDVTGTEALWATTITEVRDHGTYTGPFPPMDLDIHYPEVQALPFVPNASVTFEVVCTGTMLGTVSVVMKFLDGQLVAVMPDAADVDVKIQMPFRSMLHLRRGEWTILDCLDGGQVWGSQGAIITLAGILDSAPYQPVQRSCASPTLALADLGDVAPFLAKALRAL